MKNFQFIFLFVGIYFSTPVVAQTDYNNVATIFYTHCTKCHHEGGGAPFSLMTFDEASGMSASIHSAISNGIMPPWRADTVYITNGKKAPRFLHENTLTHIEKNAILKWINDGALEGDASLVPQAPKYGDMPYKLNGNPDLTLQIPDFRSNATTANSNPYNCFSIPTQLTKDRWLRAFEIVPGNLKAVHHVVVTVDTLASTPTDTTGNCITQGGQFDIIVWNPGGAPVIFPSKAPLKTGIRIPKGSNLILQIHYAPGTGGQLDSTKIRMFFYPENEIGIREMYSATLLQNWGIAPGVNIGGPPIPANQIKTFKANSSTSPLVKHPVQPTTDFSIFSVNPHSHKVCTKIKNYAFSGTDTLPLISISNWDYKWEGNYFFPKPVKIPTGYTLESEHVYNNTIANKQLSGPPKNTNWGTANADEMLFDGFLYFDYKVGDENIDLRSIIESDTLLRTSIQTNIIEPFQCLIYPNPSADNLNIYLSKKSVYLGTIFTITGQSVLQTGSFYDKVTIDVKGLPPGLYIVEIRDIKTNEKISKKLMVGN